MLIVYYGLKMLPNLVLTLMRMCASLLTNSYRVVSPMSEECKLKDFAEAQALHVF